MEGAQKFCAAPFRLVTLYRQLFFRLTFIRSTFSPAILSLIDTSPTSLCSNTLCSLHFVRSHVFLEDIFSSRTSSVSYFILRLFVRWCFLSMLHSYEFIWNVRFEDGNKYEKILYLNQTSPFRLAQTQNIPKNYSNISNRALLRATARCEPNGHVNLEAHLLLCS